MAKNHSEGKLDTVIGPDTTVTGDFRVTGSLRLDGQIDGKVDVGDTFLSGPDSRLKGELQCKNAVIAGRIEGNITAKEMVELQSGAKVYGNIDCRGLMIQQGCFFEGNCTMSRSGEETPLTA